MPPSQYHKERRLGNQESFPHILLLSIAQGNEAWVTIPSTQLLLFHREQMAAGSNDSTPHPWVAASPFSFTLDLEFLSKPHTIHKHPK